MTMSSGRAEKRPEKRVGDVGHAAFEKDMVGLAIWVVGLRRFGRKERVTIPHTVHQITNKSGRSGLASEWQKG